MNIILLWLIRILALYFGALMSLGNMSLFLGSKDASFFYRLLASYGTLVVCAIYGVFASLVLRLFGYHRTSQWTVARAFKWTMWLTTGVSFRILGGQEHLQTRPAVFIGNHQTALDVLLLGYIFPKYCAVTAKKSLKRTPFLGWFMALSGTVFIDRANRTTAMKAFEDAAQEMRDKRQSVFIFPEGTRSNAPEPMMLPFKKGAFHLAIQAKVPIVPVVAACYWGVLSAKEWRFRRGEIPVIVLPPIPTENLDASDVDQLTKYTRDLMLKALIKLTESPRGQQAFKAEPGELVLPVRAAPDEPAETKEESTAPDNMEVKKDDPDALRKRVTEKELHKSVILDGIDGALK